MIVPQPDALNRIDEDRMERQVPTERIDYLDWLRILAVLLLIPFHTGMIFAAWPFHIKNGQTSLGLTILNAFIDNWHMPLLFLLAGAATWAALQKRCPKIYVRERCRRLLVPLVFGTLVIVPPPDLFRTRSKGCRCCGPCSGCAPKSEPAGPSCCPVGPYDGRP